MNVPKKINYKARPQCFLLKNSIVGDHFGFLYSQQHKVSGFQHNRPQAFTLLTISSIHARNKIKLNHSL